MSPPPSLGVGMVGYAFMGRAHSQAWRTVDRVFELPLRPRLAAICGRDRAATEAAAARLGWAAAETDWRALIARDDVQLIDIAAPGGLHAPIAIAALQAGKHVLCEKPLANTLAEAERMAAAADAAFPSGARAMVGFNYRRVPALALARRLVEQGRIGTLRHVRAVYLQDWLVDPDSPLTWRMQAEQAGSGALGDLGAHIVDLARFLTGDEITGVSAVSATFVEERPLPGGAETADASTRRRRDQAAAGTRRTGRVTVDDAVVFTARFGSGALGSFEATRYAAGRKNGLRIELNGVGRQPRVRPRAAQRARVLRRRRHRRRRDRRVPPDPGHRAGTSLPLRLVAARSHPRLGAHVHQPGQGPADGDRGRRAAGAVVRRRAGGAAGA